MAGCKGQTYQLTVSGSKYPVPNTYVDTDDFCHIVGKLAISCRKETKITLQIAYPDICSMVEVVENNNACNYKYSPENLPEAFDSRKFENLVLEYTQENIAVVNVYIKDPFAVTILIDENSSK